LDFDIFDYIAIDKPSQYKFDYMVVYYTFLDFIKWYLGGGVRDWTGVLKQLLPASTCLEEL